MMGNNGVMTEPTTAASADSILETMAGLGLEDAQTVVNQLQAVLNALPDDQGSTTLGTVLQAFVIGFNAGRQAAQDWPKQRT